MSLILIKCHISLPFFSFLLNQFIIINNCPTYRDNVANFILQILITTPEPVFFCLQTSKRQHKKKQLTIGPDIARRRELEITNTLRSAPGDRQLQINIEIRLIIILADAQRPRQSEIRDLHLVFREHEYVPRR